MVCIYCGNETKVINSRHQKRVNAVWRRRCCQHCGAIFSTEELSIYERTFMVSDTTADLTAFTRDMLFLSIYDACRHRRTAVSDATALTDTIVAKLMTMCGNTGIIPRGQIVALASDVLSHFDTAAQVHYLAFHPNRDTSRAAKQRPI